MISLLVCCGKENDQNNIPAWLKERIATDEKEIAADPHSYKTLGAWIKYGYNHSSYFEYHNLLFSSLPKVHHYDSTVVNYAGQEYADYQNGKCCKEYVWKGNAYFDK